MALGLLDARVVCGDPRVAEPVIVGARDRWAKQKPPWLGVLADLVAERHRSNGDVGFLLEPDLKESHGGLRDIAALLAMMQAVPVLADYVDTVAVDSARAVLTSIRVELHRRAGREQNRLLLQEQDQVADALGQPDSDALMAAVATAGRTVAWEGDDAWRRRGAWQRSQEARAVRSPGGGPRRLEPPGTGGTPSPGDPDIGLTEDEVVLTPAADVTGDASLSLRLAAVAAERNLPIARDALNLLARKAPDHPSPGPMTSGPPWSACWPPVLPPSPLWRPSTSATCSSGTSRSGPRSATSPSATRTTGSPWTDTCSRPPPTRPRWPTESRGPICSCWAPSCTTSARASRGTTPRWAWPWWPTSATGSAFRPTTWTPWSPWFGFTCSSPTPPPAATSTIRRPPNGWPRRWAVAPPWSCWLHWSRRTARPQVPPRGDRGRPGWWRNWSSAPVGSWPASLWPPRRRGSPTTSG